MSAESVVDPEGMAETQLQTSGDDPTGAMVCLYPSSEVSQALALEDGLAPDDIHCTLAYLPNVESIELLRKTVEEFAGQAQPLTGVINGFGVFLNEEPTTWAAVDAPGMPAFRQELVEALAAVGLEHADNHGFIAHLSLAHADRRTEVTPAAHELSFRQVWVVSAAGERWSYDLMGDANEEFAVHFDLGGIELPPSLEVKAHLEVRGGAEISRAVNELVSGRTSDWKYGLTDSANSLWVQSPEGRMTVVSPALKVEKAAANPWYLQIDGALVGSEEPNRNGAMWTAGDLEYGLPGVANGPLNWMHEGRTVVGSIAAAQLIGRDALSEVDKAAGRINPYIRIQAVMWNWLYPDEAEVVEMAAELGRLFISMECISESVVCAGDTGCGQTFSYCEFTRGMACEHMAQRSSARRFQNPTFLGAGLILPPARPGWAAADVQMRRAAAAIAEETFDIAGDLSPEDWEAMMMSVLKSLD